jgi:hypothetical protein
VFTELATRIASVSIKGRTVPITSITYETNDGYWLFAEDEYPEWIGPFGASRWGYDPSSGGRKVSHTGYHILDIVPWLIRYSRPGDIDNALVYASFWRPIDSFTTFPLRRDKSGNLSIGCNRESTQALEKKLECLSEVNAQVQIAFRSGVHKRCQVMISFLHEGISGPNAGGTARLKYEQMNLHQGPAAAASFRRFAGLDLGAAPMDLGGKQHGELFFFRNTSILSSGAPVEHVPVVPEDDTLPAHEFFRVLAMHPSPGNSSVVSPVSDHEIGIRLLKAGIRPEFQIFPRWLLWRV